MSPVTIILSWIGNLFTIWLRLYLCDSTPSHTGSANANVSSASSPPGMVWYIQILPTLTASNKFMVWYVSSV